MRLAILLVFFSINIAYAEDLAQQYYNQNPSEERKIIIDFITKQFIEKKLIGVSQKELDQVWNDENARNILHMARFQIIDNKLYAASSSIHRPYFLNLFNYFKYFVRKYKVKDVDFIIYARDEIPENNINPDLFKIPAFMMFKNYDSEQETNTLIMPDSSFLKTNWQNLCNKIIDNREKYSWQNKIAKFFWRGSATGGDYGVDAISNLPRLKIAFLSKLYPDIIDAQLVNPIYQQNNSGKKLKNIIDLLFGKDNRKISEIDHLKYKYLLSLDGNSATGTRIPWIMLSNSILIKQESKKIEWFYPALKPYIHYIPLKKDLTDLLKLYNWLENNQEQLKNIIKNSNHFVANNLTSNDIDMQMQIILDQYYYIQKDKKIISTLKAEDDVISISAVLMVMLKKWQSYISNLFS